MGYTPHVLVVGGGPVGAGLARDFAVRGLQVTLADAGPLAAPGLGRMGGLLTSGAPFAREDPAYARRCLAENRTLFETASHCVADTGGLVVDDDLEGLQTACADCSITANRRSGAELREREPGLAEGIDAALAVPDAAIDPSLLTVATARDASRYGADIRPWTRVTDIAVESGAVEAAVLRQDPLARAEGYAADTEREPPTGGTADGDNDGGDGSDEEESRVGSPPDAYGRELDDGGETVEPRVDRLGVDYVVNAAGADADRVATLADCSVPVTQGRTTTVVYDGRPVEVAVTRSTDGAPASVVPVGQQTLVADRQGADGGSLPGPSSVDGVSESLAALVPAVADGPAMRAHREPRYEAGEGRDFAVLDHDRQGCWGLLTVLGGTVTTHRWVAERVCDRVCAEFGIRRACQTDELVLPGSGASPASAGPDSLGPVPTAHEHPEGPNPVVCPCRSVTRAEVAAALDDETSAEADLRGVRVRTAAATGPCQGGRCAHRLAAELHPEYELDVVEGACAALLAERWRGQRPVTGPQQTEMARTYRHHAGTMNRGHEHDLEAADIAGFDTGVAAGHDRPTCCPRAGWR